MRCLLKTLHVAAHVALAAEHHPELPAATHRAMLLSATVSAATHREMLLSATVSAHHLSVSAHECTACLFFDVSLSTTNGNGRLEYDKQEQTPYSVLIGLDWEQ